VPIVLSFYFIRKFLVIFFYLSLFLGIIIGIFELVDSLKMGYPVYTVFKSVILNVISRLYSMMAYTSLGAGVICLYQMRQNKEFLVYRYLGFSDYHFLGVFAFIIMLFSIVDIFVFNPSVVFLYDKIRMIEAKKDTLAINISPSGVWLRDQDDEEYRYLHAKTIIIQDNTFEDVKVLALNKVGQFQSYWYAKKAILKNNEWLFFDVRDAEDQTHEMWVKKTVLSSDDIKVFAKQNFIPFMKLSKSMKLFKKLNLSTDYYRLLWHKFVTHYVYFFALLFIGLLIILNIRSIFSILMVTLFAGLSLFFISEYILSYVMVYYEKSFYLLWIFPLTVVGVLWKRL